MNKGTNGTKKRGPRSDIKPTKGRKSTLKRQTISGDALKSSIVAINCKLTNTVIDLNQAILEKQKNYEKLMTMLIAEKNEKWFLLQKLSRRDETVKNRQKQIKDLKDNQFSENLIQLDESGIPAGNSRINFER